MLSAGFLLERQSAMMLTGNDELSWLLLYSWHWAGESKQVWRRLTEY